MSEHKQLIGQDALRLARSSALRSGRPIMAELEAMTQLEPRVMLRAVAEHFHFTVLETADMFDMKPAFDLLPLGRAQQRGCVVMKAVRAGEPPVAVVADPFDADLQVWLESISNTTLSYRLALLSDIQAYLTRQEESMSALDALVADDSVGVADARALESLTFASVSNAASPAVKLVNSTLYDALKQGVSDIHMESTPAGMVTKYRIDGVLDQVASIPGVVLAEHVISRIKVLSELDISERRVPQDGSFRVEALGREIDLRVSIMPSIHGEDAVIRILDKQAMVEAHGGLTLDAAGFDPHTLAILRRLVQEPYGMVLVTGPTGSGKTTTLYAALTEINHGRDKIITIEDPVEYQLPGILQIPVNDKKGLTFARGLRSILRHDPDKIMVGEIRDRETAEIAVQSALTGHLVLSTVHANNVYDVFGRFYHMGVDLYSFVSALNGVIAQRLVRLNCTHCAVPYRPTDEELVSAGLTAEAVQDFVFMRGRGCGDCRGSGYRGRKAVAEVLTMNPAIAELIVERRSVRQIMEAAQRNGTRSLYEDALSLVARGETTLEEVRRVTLAT
ncbi:MAG: general secretion pathway protein GspE [Candidatus Dactylopiibacterium carminicum]|uniref:General secretion pathway protein GspE n=1 Tax=Candidatus Dactylopiibacterium carminicum TaxID=857335 RepID=A0A272ES96_9RHOO|nr:GspE/PulE family protein [Candidatus Dactylopiibacterium carminicum]KAF7598752.1 type II/IV secretion system protein [Candidatus Dactylopiibacterium carminicum]PAS92590.1 MAG: general secretion pathway protein GspE [Candidatus Dactylopiibacterium carminicum]PAS98773.1 MAG: general secretion pathway protein GspE [Candidatus Dactylopiibacterium carminicum]